MALSSYCVWGCSERCRPPCITVGGLCTSPPGKPTILPGPGGVCDQCNNPVTSCPKFASVSAITAVQCKGASTFCSATLTPSTPITLSTVATLGLCVSRVEGGNVCAPDNQIGTNPGCQSDADCSGGRTCIKCESSRVQQHWRTASPWCGITDAVIQKTLVSFREAAACCAHLLGPLQGSSLLGRTAAGRQCTSAKLRMRERA